MSSKICIVINSQLTKAKTTDYRPDLSRLNDGLDYISDTVVFIYLPGHYGKQHKYRPDLNPNTISELIIAKGRNIGTGSDYVGFNADLSKFFNI